MPSATGLAESGAMTAQLLALLAIFSTLLSPGLHAQSAKIYNTAKQKLLEGKPLIGATVSLARSQHLLRHGQRGLRFHLDRNAAQPAHLFRRRAR